MTTVINLENQQATKTELSLSFFLSLSVSCSCSLAGSARGIKRKKAEGSKMLVITIENPAVTLVGLMGNLLSALVVLAPVPTFYRILKKKSTESFQSVPYVVGLFSAMMWTYYGLLTSDVLLLTINVGVCLLEVIYLTIFLMYAPRKAKVFTVKLILLVNVGVVAGLVLFSFLLIKGKRRAQITGGICASFAVSVFVAPLSIIRLVIRTKSVEYMPFSLSFFLTLSAIAWLSYGVLIHDMFVALPNVLGFLFGMAQIILYLMYMNYNKDASSSKESKLIDGDQVEIEVPTVDIQLPEKKNAVPMSTTTPMPHMQCAPLQVPSLVSNQCAHQVMVEV